MWRLLKQSVQRAFLLMRDLLAPFLGFREVSILCYHSVGDVPFETNVTASELQSHLQFLQNHGYVFVSLGDIVEWMEGERALPRRAVALTFDDGYADFETAALPLLKKHRAPAALFVVGDARASRAYLGPENNLLDGEALGHLAREPMVEIGYHARTHPDLEKVSGAELAAEIKPPFPAKYFAYPGGHYSQEAIEAVKRAGYVAAFSIKPTLVTKTSDRYLLPRNVITKDTAPWQLRFATTKAVAWYRALWRLFL